MNEDLTRIREIQEFDFQIFGQLKNKEELPSKLAELKKAIEKAQADKESNETRIKELEAEKRKGERDAIDEKEALEKSKERLNTITTNREYDAVHEELGAHERKLKSVEEHTLSLMEAHEEATKEKETIESWLKEIQEKNTPQIQELERDIAEIDDKIGVVDSKRSRLTEQLPARVLRMYDRILNGRKTKQVIGNVSPDKRNCSFCFKSLTLQQVNEVRRNEEINTCDNCGSILLWMEKEDGKD